MQRWRDERSAAAKPRGGSTSLLEEFATGILALTGEIFLAYVEQCLVPTLRRNEIVVMDNCRIHLGTGIRNAIEARGATVRFLPKYSPDLNPIELPYSKLKEFLRKVAARTVPGLTRAIRSFIPQLSPRECANYFSHAGYASI
jgi:transposase